MIDVERKLCPFSYNSSDFDPMKCIEENCMAWGAKIEKHPNCPDGDWVNGCRLIP